MIDDVEWVLRGEKMKFMGVVECEVLYRLM